MKICNDCGRELPDEAFQITRNGVSRFNVCKACRAAKAAKTRQDNAQKWGGVNNIPFPMRTSTTRPPARSYA